MLRACSRLLSLPSRSTLFRRSASSSVSVAAPVNTGPLPAGSLLVWGQRDLGRLGIPREQDASASAVGLTHNAFIKDVVQVVCRNEKTVALTQDGTVYSWGTCANYSLGQGDDTRTIVRPKKIDALAGVRIVHIAAGDTATAAVSADGGLFTWGWGGSWFNGNGGLGHGDNATQPRPTLVRALEAARTKLVHVSVGSQFMVGLTTKGEVLTWGKGEYGRLGSGSTATRLAPEPVGLLDGTMCVQVAAGSQHALALTADGRVFAWGKNSSGQLGQGGALVADLNTMEAFPLIVEASDDVQPAFSGRVVQIAAGTSHSLALTHDGRVFQWGQSNFLQPSPVPLCYTHGGKTAEPLQGAVLAAGDGASAVIDPAGRLFAWGKGAAKGKPASFGWGSALPSHLAPPGGEALSFVHLGPLHGAAIVGNPVRRTPPPLAASRGSRG